MPAGSRNKKSATAEKKSKTTNNNGEGRSSCSDANTDQSDGQNELQVNDSETDTSSPILEAIKCKDSLNTMPSDTLFCFEDVYCESTSGECTPQTPLTLEDLDHWTSEMTPSSLVVGDGVDATALRDQIAQVTLDHVVQICHLEETFELCNRKGYLLIWLMMKMPVGQEILSLTTSIRYASKCNRGTVIIGVANTSSSVDLRLHGIDEIAIQPLSLSVVRQKYSKWSSVQLAPAKEPLSPYSDDRGPANLSNPATPMTPATPVTPATPATPATPVSLSDESNFSISIDSGVESPPTLTQIGTVQLPSISQLRSLVPKVKQDIRSRQNNATDHTTKEKLRRERIKDSCDQLRVLLPYVRGRKTDMASILEMCVEYLKLVNAALPLEFQNQVAEILTSSCPMSNTRGRAAKKGKREILPDDHMSSAASMTSGRNLESADGKADSSVLDFSSQSSKEMQKPVLKREMTASLTEIRPAKRICIPTSNSEYLQSTQSPSNMVPVPQMPSLQSFEPAKISKLDTNNMDKTTSYTTFQSMHHMPHAVYGDYDNPSRPVGSHDGFASHQFYSGGLPHNTMDRDGYGLYLENQPMFHFYGNGSLAPNGCAIGNISDYVNPNAVLPMSYNGKMKPEGLQYEEQVSNMISMKNRSTENLNDEEASK